MIENKLLLKLSALLLLGFQMHTTSVNACTIVSGVSCNGHVWNANNEDGPLGIANFLNVFPQEKDSKYGFYTLCYISPIFSSGGKIQGGMNEMGLTFDFAAIEPQNKSELQNKKSFPKGDEAILTYILGNMSSTMEVVSFFRTYWFQSGFLTAQMHVADKNGIFANISPSGIEIIKNGESLITTNFDICGKEDSSSCWRYPIATELLSEEGANLSTMMALCKNTAQKTGGTMYSNIQNLTTGDIWLLSKHDNGVIVKTNIDDLLKKGKRSYTFSDLRSIISDRQTKPWVEPKPVTLEKNIVNNYAGNYYNWYIGEITVEAQEDAIVMRSSFAPSETLIANSENSFFIPDAKIAIEFVLDEETGERTLQFFENGHWSFSAEAKMK